MKKNLLNAARYLILFTILGFGGWYFHSNYDRIAAQASFTKGNIALLIALNIATIFVETIRLRLTVKKVGYDPGQLVSAYLFGLMQAVNHVIVKAGTFSTGYYLSRRGHISFHSYLAFVVTYIVFFVLGSGLLGLVVSMGYTFTGFQVSYLIYAFFLAITFLSLLFMALANVRLPLHRFPRFLSQILGGVRFIYSDVKLIASLALVEMVYYTLCSLRFMVAITMFSGSISFLDSVVVTTVGNFIRIASFVPGGLGVGEVVSGWTAGLLGNEAGLSGIALGLDRLIYVVCIAMLAGVGFFSLSGRSEFHPPSNDERDAEALEEDVHNGKLTGTDC